MIHLHLIGLLTFQFLTLIASLFLLIYVKKHQLNKWFLHFSKAIVIAMHIIIIATFIHAIVHHASGHCDKHKNMIEKHKCQ